MRIAVLTTQTPHHAYFVRELGKLWPVELVLAETQGVTPPFDVSHPFEKARDAFERDCWFNGEDPRLQEFAPTSTVPSVNSPEAEALLAEAAPDVMVVFGTGKIGPKVIALQPSGIINLHGGDPERYRGLDTHLWAVYHNEFNELITTLHRLNENLDDGEIISKTQLALTRGMGLHQLRKLNTEACLNLVLDALRIRQRTGRFDSKPQLQKGRYYSFMPAVLKELCVKKFSRYTEGL